MAARASSRRRASSISTTRIREAAIKAAEYLGGAYRDGYVPPSAINWNDADDNNAFHAKLMVMDVDGTISTEVAIKAKHPEWYFDEIVTDGLLYPTTNDGKPITCITAMLNAVIPKGAKNVPVAKEFLKFLIQPEVLQDTVETGLGRNLPPMPELAKTPFWENPKDPHLKGYVQQGAARPDPAGLLRLQSGDGGGLRAARLQQGNDRRGKEGQGDRRGRRRLQARSRRYSPSIRSSSRRRRP